MLTFIGQNSQLFSWILGWCMIIDGLARILTYGMFKSELALKMARKTGDNLGWRI